MATAGDQIDAALRLIGVLAEGETPSPETTTDALSAMSQMLDSWSTERLVIFCTQDQVFTWPSGQSSRTLGPSGNFVGERPIQLDAATYFKDTINGVSYPIHQINRDQYDLLPVKTIQSTYPQLLFVNYEMPDVRMYVYPVPTKDLEFHFISVDPLTQVTSRATELTFPPGYLRAFKYNLACELAPEFGVEPSTTVNRIAMSSKRNLKRINNPGDFMSMPRDLVSTRPRFNIFSGNM